MPIKKGDKVIYKGNIYTIKRGQRELYPGNVVVWLEGFSGCFSVENLETVSDEINNDNAYEYDRLKEVKEQHEVMKKKDFFGQTLHPRDIDWLIERVEQYEKVLKEIRGFTKYEGNGWYEKVKQTLGGV